MFKVEIELIQQIKSDQSFIPNIVELIFKIPTGCCTFDCYLSFEIDKSFFSRKFPRCDYFINIHLKEFIKTVHVKYRIKEESKFINTEFLSKIKLENPDKILELIVPYLDLYGSLYFYSTQYRLAFPKLEKLRIFLINEIEKRNRY